MDLVTRRTSPIPVQVSSTILSPTTLTHSTCGRQYSLHVGYNRDGKAI